MTKWSQVIDGATRNKAEFLLDGAEYFKSIVEAIKTTGTKDKDKNYVYILGWMLDINLQLVEGAGDKTLFNLLKDLNAGLQDHPEKGVEIRILIPEDPLGKYAALGRDAVEKLKPPTF